MSADLLELLEPAPAPTKSPQSILIIEDDAGQREALQYRLSRQGYITRAAGTGEEGLAMARQDPPHLVLLDLRLPDMEGFELGEQLADDPTTAGVPVIVLSGMERPDIVRRTRAAGCRFFMRKPYDPNALLVLIKSALEESSIW